MMTYDEFYQAKFISKKEYGGMKINNIYTIRVTENRPYGILVTILGEEDFSNIVPYCNLKSVERVWEIKK